MPRRKRNGTGPIARMKRAEHLLEETWAVLEPEDLSKDKWGKLQELILHLRAKQNRLQQGK